jgi:hypothetical protein
VVFFSSALGLTRFSLRQTNPCADLNPNHVPLDCKFKHVYVLHPTSDGDEALNLGMACVKGHQVRHESWL